MESTPSPVYYSRNADDNFFRKKHNTTICFAIGLLLFLMPFAELRCGGMTLMKNSGLGIAIGSEWKVAMGGNSLMDKMNKDAKGNDAKKALSSGMNIFLLVAIASAIFGLGIAFSEQKWKHTAVMCAGILSALMLIAAMIQLNIALKSGLSKSADAMEDSKMGGSLGSVIKMKYTIWYYLSLAGFAAAAFFGFKHNKIEMEDALERVHDFEFQHQQNS